MNNRGVGLSIRPSRHEKGNKVECNLQLWIQQYRQNGIISQKSKTHWNKQITYRSSFQQVKGVVRKPSPKRSLRGQITAKFCRTLKKKNNINSTSLLENRRVTPKLFLWSQNYFDNKDSSRKENYINIPLIYLKR